MKKFSYLSFLLLANALMAISVSSTEVQTKSDTEPETTIDISKIGKIDDETQLYDKTTNMGEIALNGITKKPKSITNEKAITACPVRKIYSGDKKALLNDNYFIVAKVNSDIVTNIDIMNAIRFIFFSSGKPFDKTKASLMIRSILLTEIYGKLQEQVAQRNQMKISDADVNKRIKEIAQRNGMTVEELADHFERLGISMPVFKTSIASKMLFSCIVEAMKNDIDVSQKEINEEKKQLIEANKNTRYKLYEIHLSIDDIKHKPETINTAKTIISLIDEGFNFPVLAESISQGNYKLQTGDLGWVSEKNMERSIKDAVVKLKVGQHTNIIETSSGIKIIFLEDKADSNKMGYSEAVYKYMKTSLQYKGGIMTSKDIQKVDNIIEELKSAKTPENFRKICVKYNLNIEDNEEKITNPFMLEVIESSKLAAQTMQSFDKDDYVDIYFTESKTIPDANEPTNQEIEYAIISRKVAKLFQRNFKQAENVAFVEIDENNLKKLIQTNKGAQ